MADGRSSLASDFKAGKGGQAGEENQSDTDGGKSLVRNGIMRDESAGLVDGVSVREAFSVSDVEPNYDYEHDPLTGNTTDRKKPCSEITVSSKGKSFTIDNEL